jgi:hypothetical protein
LLRVLILIGQTHRIFDVPASKVHNRPQQVTSVRLWISQALSIDDAPNDDNITEVTQLMFLPNDAQFARDRFNDRLREAEQRRLIQSLQPKQPNLFNLLKSELAALANLARPQRSRASRV